MNRRYRFLSSERTDDISRIKGDIKVLTENYQLGFDFMPKFKYCLTMRDSLKNDVLCCITFNYVGRNLSSDFPYEYSIMFDDEDFEERFYEAFIMHNAGKLDRLIRQNGDARGVDTFGLAKYICGNIYYFFNFRRKTLDVDDEYLFNLTLEYLKDIHLVNQLPVMHIDDFLFEIVGEGGNL